MSRTVTALYDTRAEAEAAKQRLSSAVDVDKVKIIDKDGSGSSGSSGGGYLDKFHLSHDDRHAYDEGIRRGGFLLCAEVDGDEDADRIVRILEESSGVDLDERQESWRSEGWAPYSSASSGSAMNTGSGFQEGRSSGTTGTTGSVIEEEHIPIVEEELRVGKREVHRGGARVRSYIREVPVHEQVTLREEHVSVERRPVNETLGRDALDRDSDLLHDRTIEMTETAEEAVVAKEARVREELVVRKTATERTEQIDETVRHTEVEVDEGTGTSGERSAFGSFGTADRNNNNR